jgi:hypothetical protein
MPLIPLFVQNEVEVAALILGVTNLTGKVEDISLIGEEEARNLTGKKSSVSLIGKVPT